MASTASSLDNLNTEPSEAGIMARQPRNLNVLNTTAYRLVFARMPEVEYTCQRVSIPSLILGGPVLVPTPFSDTPNPKIDIITDGSALNVTIVGEEKLSPEMDEVPSKLPDA